MRVEKGHSYIGAAKRPFFVSKKTIEEALINLGFTQVRVFDQTEWEQAFREKGGVPSTFTALPGYEAHEWNTVAQGVRSGESADIPLPVTPAWVLDLPPAAPGAAPGPAAPAGPLIAPSVPGVKPAPSTAMTLPGWVAPVSLLGLGAFGLVGSVWYTWRSWSKKDDGRADA